MKKIFLIFLLIITSTLTYSQVKDYELGSSNFGRNPTQGGFYDYSDPSSVNIKVSVWGYVKFPGRYTVPLNSTLLDIISYAGGPLVDANLDDVRLYKPTEETNEKQITKFNYNSLLWEKEMKNVPNGNPQLEAGDVIVLTGEPKYFFRDNLSMWLSIFSVLISLSILILNIARN